MRHITDTTYKGHEVCLFQADDGTYTIDVRTDTEAGPMLAGFHQISTRERAYQLAHRFIDRHHTPEEGVGVSTPHYKCFTCGETKLRHYLTYEWVHARGDSLCDDVALPFPITTPRDAS